MRKTRPAQMVLQLRRHRRRGGKLRCSRAVGSGRHERRHVRAEPLEERSQPIGLVLHALRRVATQDNTLQRRATCCDAGQHVATQGNMRAQPLGLVLRGRGCGHIRRAPPARRWACCAFQPIDNGQRQPHEHARHTGNDAELARSAHSTCHWAGWCGGKG